MQHSLTYVRIVFKNISRELSTSAFYPSGFVCLYFKIDSKIFVTVSIASEHSFIFVECSILKFFFMLMFISSNFSIEEMKVSRSTVALILSSTNLCKIYKAKSLTLLSYSFKILCSKIEEICSSVSAVVNVN